MNVSECKRIKSHMHRPNGYIVYKLDTVAAQYSVEFEALMNVVYNAV
jgi:hypothetical protein